ncbi:MAG: GDP-mannose 4,6-dehydratase [Victivallaceae bacterium]|nr:GDP-mannose 4,6-dehydratase [Victivallaceae bacterium]
MRFLITGGAGFIGGHLTESLLADGHQVTVIDNFSTGSRANLAAVQDNPALRVIECDIVTDAETVNAETACCDAVIHLAAAVGVELVVHDPARTITTNVHGAENVLLAAARHHKRIIAASTSEVYGKSSHESFSESDDLLIGSPFNARWSYACSKLLDEFFLMALRKSSGLDGTIVRFFNTVGPRQTGQYGMVIPRFVGHALKNEPLEVYGDGGQSRCFCHVSDVVRAIRLLIKCKRADGAIFNIGSRREITIRALAELVIARTGSRSEIHCIPYDQAYEAGFEDMRRRLPDVSRIREFTGWQSELSLERIIDDVAASLR